MTTPDHDESKPRRRWPTYLAIVLVLVLIGYPLSIGPTMVVYDRTDDGIFTLAFETLYGPLRVFAELTGTKGFFQEYAEWWTRTADRLLPK